MGLNLQRMLTMVVREQGTVMTSVDYHSYNLSHHWQSPFAVLIQQQPGASHVCPLALRSRRS